MDNPLSTSKLEDLVRTKSPLSLVAQSILESTASGDTLSVEAQYKAVAGAFKRVGVDLPAYQEDANTLMPELLNIFLEQIPKLLRSDEYFEALISDSHPTDEEIENVKDSVQSFREGLSHPREVFEKYGRASFFEKMKAYEKRLYAEALLDFCSYKNLTPHTLWTVVQ